MNEQNDFEKQVEQEERAYTEPEQVEYESTAEASGVVNDIVEKVKEVVKKGNVTKIVIKKDDNILVNIPLNVGIVGGIIGAQVFLGIDFPRGGLKRQGHIRTGIAVGNRKNIQRVHRFAIFL